MFYLSKHIQAHSYKMDDNILEAQVSTEKRREEKGYNKNMTNLKHIKTNMKKNDDDAIEVEESLLSPSSRMFHEPDWNVYILGIMGWKTPPGGPNLDLIKDNLANTLVKEPRFSSLQVMDKENGGEVRWVPTEVNLDKHMIIHHLDSNKNSSTEELVDDYITTLTRTSMDMSKPLWEIHILLPKSTNDNNSSSFVSVFRIHHSLGDGVSLMTVLLSCTRKISDPNCPPDLRIPNIRKMNFQRENKGHFWNWLMRMWLFLRLFANTMIDLILFFATALSLLRDSETPIRSLKIEHDASAHRRFVRCSLSLDDIKLVKNATISTVNDVVLGVVQAGLSRYLTRQYGKEDKKDQSEKINKIVKGIRCRAAVLINLRPLLAMNGMAENYIQLGNCFGFVLLPLKLFKENNNPLDYVRFAKTTMDRKKNSLEVILTSYFFNMVLKIFGFKAATSLERGILLHTTLAFSNVMGPTEEISFCGYPMTFVAATDYGDPTALMINVVSYTNKLTIGISVDERTIPDPYKLGDDFLDSLQDMKIAALGGATTTLHI